MDVPTAGYLTARTLMRTVPAAVPGIMFLSGARRLRSARCMLVLQQQGGCAPWSPLVAELRCLSITTSLSFGC